MNPTEVHVMKVELIADRQTTRYTCPVCHRCMEDGPEGLSLLHKGDQSAEHRGGTLFNMELEVAQETPVKPVLH